MAIINNCSKAILFTQIKPINNLQNGRIYLWLWQLSLRYIQTLKINKSLWALKNLQVYKNNLRKYRKRLKARRKRWLQRHRQQQLRKRILHLRLLCLLKLQPQHQLLTLNNQLNIGICMKSPWNREPNYKNSKQHTKP